MKLATRRSLKGTLTFATLAPAALLLGATFGLEHCGGSGTADVDDASTDAATNGDTSVVDARVDARTDSATTTDSGTDAARESGTGDGGGDGSRDGSGDGRADTGTDSGNDSGVVQDSGSDASTTDAATDAATDGAAAQDAAVDGSDSGNSFQVVQTCLEVTYADRSANGATREIPWGFALGAAASRCIKIKAGQSVDWVLEDPQFAFTTHPLVVPSSNAGNTPNPISQATGAGNVKSATFPTPGIYGYVCGNGHAGMLGAVWVVPN